jgi:N-acetylmuramoyl-L-alanine amidase
VNVIDYNSYRSIKSFNQRVRFLVLHYTASNFNGSVNALTGPDVSVHYLVPDPSDKTYTDAGFSGVRVFNLVDEKDRSWHAGVSYWRGRNNLNDSSIGIEIVNQAYNDQNNNGDIVYVPYHPEQIHAVRRLAKNILQRYPEITPTNIVGHSDIAPGRKFDPGALFPWRELHHAGIGAWYEEATKAKYMHTYAKDMPSDGEILRMFGTYGYDTSSAEAPTGAGRAALVRAFQLHFRAGNYNGVMDRETAAILAALVERYY